MLRSTQLTAVSQIRGDKAYALITVLLLIFGSVFFETAYSLWMIWFSDETYSHGILILPAVVWFIWREREELVVYRFTPSLLASLLLLPAGLVWISATITQINLLSQASLMSMVLLSFWAIAGFKLSVRLALPLLLVFLSVPFGEFAEPALMRLTADSTVWLIQLSGIPVYREGLFFELPSGSWSVVKACSGSRYLYASLALGCIYSLLYLKGWRRSLLLIVFSCIVPLFANLIRAFGIVMIGHFSGMELATGVDHLIYGWVFFGLVALAVFWFGSLLARSDEGTLPSSVGPSVVVVSSEHSRNGLLVVAILISLVFFFRMTYNGVTSHPILEVTGGSLIPPGWSELALADGEIFTPVMVGGVGVNVFREDASDRTIALNVQSETLDSELIGKISVLAEPAKWRRVNFGPVGLFGSASCADVLVPIFQLVSQETRNTKFVARSYVVAGVLVSDDVEAKFLALLVRLGLKSGAPLMLTLSGDAREFTPEEMSGLLCSVAKDF